MSNIVELAGRAAAPGGTRSHGPEARNDHASVDPMMISLVGQREGQLPERSPAFHHRAAQADRMRAQGDQLSHSYLWSPRSALELSQSSQTVLNICALVFGVAFVFVAGLSITVAILFLLFSASF